VQSESIAQVERQPVPPVLQLSAPVHCMLMAVAQVPLPSHALLVSVALEHVVPHATPAAVRSHALF
jgi:hypothetical protein